MKFRLDITVFGIMLTGMITFFSAEALGQPGANRLTRNQHPQFSISSSINLSNRANLQEKTPSQWGALLRSLAVPGWGHHYVDSNNWRRGQYHLAAEVVMVTAWLGIYRQSYVVEKNMYTHAQAYSGVDIQALGRAYELAVGRHSSMDDYIDYLERSRNWDRLDDFPDSPEYRWEWESEELRSEYLDMRSRRDNLDQQLPTLTVFMVANRVLSGINAYSRARSLPGSSVSLAMMPGPHFDGIQAHVSVPF